MADTKLDFVFHSVFNDGQHTKYFNVYKLEKDRYLAECHHFNNIRYCEGDFELVKDREGWKTDDEKFEDAAKFIGEEIDRTVSE